MAKISYQESNSSVHSTKKSNTSTSSANTTSYEGLSSAIISLTASYGKLETRITNLELSSKPEKAFFRTTHKLSRLVLFTFILLPIFQLGLTIVILYSTNIESNFLSIFSWLFGFIGLGTILELIYVPLKIKEIEKRIESIENQ